MLTITIEGRLKIMKKKTVKIRKKERNYKV